MGKHKKERTICVFRLTTVNELIERCSPFFLALAYSLTHSSPFFNSLFGPLRGVTFVERFPYSKSQILTRFPPLPFFPPFRSNCQSLTVNTCKISFSRLSPFLSHSLDFITLTILCFQFLCHIPESLGMFFCTFFSLLFCL